MVSHAPRNIPFWYNLQAPVKSLKLYRFGLLSDSAYVEGVKTINTKCHQALIKLIKEARQEAGIRQTDISEEMRKQANWMSRIERGDRRIDVCQFLDLADLIGFNPY